MSLSFFSDVSGHRFWELFILRLIRNVQEQIIDDQEYIKAQQSCSFYALHLEDTYWCSLFKRTPFNQAHRPSLGKVLPAESEAGSQIIPIRVVSLAAESEKVSIILCYVSCCWYYCCCCYIEWTRI